MEILKSLILGWSIVLGGSFFATAGQTIQGVSISLLGVGPTLTPIYVFFIWLAGCAFLTLLVWAGYRIQATYPIFRVK